MEIRNWMKRPIHSVKPLDSIQHARELMEQHKVNQLPVVVDGRLVGIITDRDLRDAFPSVFDSPLFQRRKTQVTATDPRTVTVEMVMTPNVTTVAAAGSMCDAVRLMRKLRIGALPVIEADRVVGVLTRSDVLDAFLDLAEIEESREASSLSGAAAPIVAERSQKPTPRAPHGRRRSA